MSKKQSLRDRCAELSQEFSPILAARVRQAKAQKIMTARTSYKFRLNQLVSMDAREGQVWSVGLYQLSPIAVWFMPLEFLSTVSNLEFAQ